MEACLNDLPDAFEQKRVDLLLAYHHFRFDQIRWISHKAGVLKIIK